MKGEDMGFKGATTTGRLQEILMPLSWEVTKPRNGEDGFVFRGSVLLNRRTELLPTVANVAMVAFSGFFHFLLFIVNGFTTFLVVLLHVHCFLLLLLLFHPLVFFVFIIDLRFEVEALVYL